MPNWAETDLSVTLPTRKAGEFKSYFLSHNPDENKDRKKYFGRTFLNDVDEEKNRNGMSLLRISCDCAWSADSCMATILGPKKPLRRYWIVQAGLEKFLLPYLSNCQLRIRMIISPKKKWRKVKLFFLHS